MIDIRNFENHAENTKGGYLAEKYSNSGKAEEDFIAARSRLINTLHDNIALMEREYASLHKYMNDKTRPAFEEKCLGWSKVVNGAEILYKMYVEKANDYRKS